jgi:hypothetical protein
MAAGVASLIGGLAVVMLVVSGMFVFCGCGVMLMRVRLGTVCGVCGVPGCGAVGATGGRRKCSQTLQRQGQQQQPDGNQSQRFHGWKFRGFRALLQCR